MSCLDFSDVMFPSAAPILWKCLPRDTKYAGIARGSHLNNQFGLCKRGYELSGWKSKQDYSQVLLGTVQKIVKG